MIGLVLVTHGRLAAEFLAAMEHVVGPQAMVRAVCIGADVLLDRRVAARRRAQRVDVVRVVQEADVEHEIGLAR